MQIGRTKALVAISIVGITIGILWLGAPTTPEPAYRGRSLTRWLKQLDDGQAGGISSGALPSLTAAQVEAGEAIRAMGAEALPLLLRDIHASPSSDSFRFKAQRGFNLLLWRLTGRGFWFSDVTEQDRIRWRAAQGLAALGPLAAPAVPELKRLLFTNYFHSSIKEAAYVLAAVGPKGIEILTDAVQPQAEWSGMCAIWALGQHPQAGTNTIPFLISATSSSSEGTACGAIQVLGLFHLDGEEVIPALTNALVSANPSVARDAAQALGRFGPQAASAVPLLHTLTNNPALRVSALEALQKIGHLRD